ncbi:MAG: carboxypeptidase regulatory-like domain-containing protein [Gemmatimonadales bacterium]
MTRWLGPLLFLALLARLAAAQTPATTRAAPGATVSGVVRDSVAHTSLAGAVVQLVPADNSASFILTAVSDSLGRFTLGDVPDGRYKLGFIHPMLDSLGVEPPLRDVYVNDRRSVRADLGIPSPARIRAAICGTRPATDSGAVIVGVVRDARDGAPAAGVSVSAEWFEVSFTPQGLVRRIPRLVATTGENGWFAICNVPSAGIVALHASRGTDSTDLIEVQVPAEGFLRRELYLGPARTVIIRDTALRVDSLARAPRRLNTGNIRLSGTVIAAARARPLAGAQVGVADGPQTRTNASGEWTIIDAPAGTRMLEVRALGFYPERRPVDVVAGAPPIRVALSTLKAVLDTVRISASRIRYDRDRNGFQQRRRSGFGRYLTQQDVARWRPIDTSDLFRLVPGVRVERSSNGFEKHILIRGPFGMCSPTVYVDDHAMNNFTADDIDSWVSPKDIAGIEIYTGAGVPAQFQQGLSGCGSIVIWTK